MAREKQEQSKVGAPFGFVLANGKIQGDLINAIGLIAAASALAMGAPGGANFYIWLYGLAITAGIVGAIALLACAWQLLSRWSNPAYRWKLSAIVVLFAFELALVIFAFVQFGKTPDGSDQGSPDFARGVLFAAIFLVGVQVVVAMTNGIYKAVTKVLKGSDLVSIIALVGIGAGLGIALTADPNAPPSFDWGTFTGAMAWMLAEMITLISVGKEHSKDPADRKPRKAFDGTELDPMGTWELRLHFTRAALICFAMLFFCILAGQSTASITGGFEPFAHVTYGMTGLAVGMGLLLGGYNLQMKHKGRKVGQAQMRGVFDDDDNLPRAPRPGQPSRGRSKDRHSKRVRSRSKRRKTKPGKTG